MESSPNAHQDLADAERAAASVYVDYPTMPRWYAPVTGVWAAALTAVLILLHDRPWWSIIATVALIALDLAFIGWYRGKRGTMPSMRHAPPEIKREMSRFVVGCAVVLAAVAACAWLLGSLAAILLALVLVTVGVELYERRYARAADAVRARVA